MRYREWNSDMRIALRYLVGKSFVDIIWPLYSLALFRNRSYADNLVYEK